jgi:transcriptional regulatory protein LevR
LKKKYEAERKIRDDYLTEYENAKKILQKLQSNYDMETEDIAEFKKLEKFIEKIFHNSKC